MIGLAKLRRNWWRLAGLTTVLTAIALTIVFVMASGEGSLTEGTSSTNPPVRSREAAAAVALARAPLDIGTRVDVAALGVKDIFVSDMTWNEHAEKEGGILGEDVPNKDKPVWIVVIEPQSTFTQTDRGHESTYHLIEMVISKNTGTVIGTSLYYPGREPIIPMNEETRVSLP